MLSQEPVRRFALFGPEHLAALAIIAAVAVALTLLVRSGRAPERSARVALSAFLVAATAIYLAVESSLRPLDAWDFAPLHLCDMAIFVAVLALLSRSRLAAEVLYFWACSGTLLATVTPDLWYGFPHRHFFAYFALHGGVIISAIVLTFGCGVRPRSGAPWRVLLVTNGYAAVVAAVNLIFGTNYLYLMRKPPVPTVLDLLGPWPIYILSVELVAAALFWLLHLAAAERRA